MTKVWFMDRCRVIWEEEGLERLDGHSFWIGGTTHHLMSGIDPWVVMVIGCWSYKSFLTYWCKVEEFLPNFISEAYESIESLTLYMSCFRHNMSLS